MCVTFSDIRRTLLPQIGKMEPWPYPDFLHVMQIYTVSHAIYQSKCDLFKRRLRAYYHQLSQDKSSGNFRMVSEVVSSMFNAGLDGAWEMGGNLAGLSGQEVSASVKDDRVLKACFFSQVLWLCADDDLTKNIVAMSILSGSPHRKLDTDAPRFSKHVHEVLSVLGDCPEYTFKACPGFDIILHLAHIRNEVLYEDNRQSGFCPFQAS